MKNLKRDTLFSIKAFTMVELLLVMAAIGTMGVVAAPMFLDYRKEARESAAKSIEQNVSSAIKLQTKNKVLRCGSTATSYPSIESLRANDIVAGADCPSTVIGAADRRFLASSDFPPRNPINGLRTIELATSNPDAGIFASGKCSDSPSAAQAGWCYNPQTGTFWASTNTNSAGNSSSEALSPASSLASSASSLASSASSLASSVSSVSSSVSSLSSSEISVASSSSTSSLSSLSSSSSSSIASLSSSSVSSVASSASSQSSVAFVGGGGGGGVSASSASSQSSSSIASSSSSLASSSSSIASSSSSSSLASSSSSSSSSSPALYSSCLGTPVDQRITVAAVAAGTYSLPSASLFTNGGSQKYCVCKPQGNGFNIQSPSANGLLTGNGHQSSFFILASACQ